MKCLKFSKPFDLSQWADQSGEVSHRKGHEAIQETSGGFISKVAPYIFPALKYVFEILPEFAQKIVFRIIKWIKVGLYFAKFFSQ